MFQALLNIFKIPELRNKLAFTLGMLVFYRIGFWVPLPGIDQPEMTRFFEDTEGPMQDIFTYVSIFTGGALQQSSLFGLGILPYISAAIIMQLMASVVDSLKQLQREPNGRQKIQEYTRYLTLGLCLVQSMFYVRFFHAQGFVMGDWINTPTFWLTSVVGMTTGTMFLVWLGEQIDKYGIGNGASLIITAGIIAEMPNAIGTIWNDFSLQVGADAGQFNILHVIFLVAAFVLVVAGTTLITQGQRRIPVQQAKHTRGRRVYGGQRHYLPLRVNHGGVMPIIFASSLMMFPAIVLPWIASVGERMDWPRFQTFFNHLAGELSMTGYNYPYVLAYIAMIYFFAYFWTSVQFQPREMAEQLRDHGSFIPGLRPGPRTSDYLNNVMERITYVGAGFLAIVAVIPTIINAAVGVPFQVAAFLGGTGLLITVSVTLDFVQRIEATMLMRNYQGFLSGQDSGKGPRIRGPRR